MPKMHILWPAQAAASQMRDRKLFPNLTCDINYEPYGGLHMTMGTAKSDSYIVMRILFNERRH